MTRKSYSIIPVFAAVALIPQLLFWWLAPVGAVSRIAVYIGGTVLTAGIPAAYLLTCWRSDLRRAAGLLVVCCILEATVVAIAAALLWIDVVMRSAVFALAITALFCLIVLIPMISAALKQPVQGIRFSDFSTELDEMPAHMGREGEGRSGAHTGAGVCAPERRPTDKPLPPRNR